MRRLGGVVVAVLLAAGVFAPAARAAEYPSNWQNCQPSVSGVFCEGLVTLKSTDWGTARNLCRAKIVEQAVGLGWKGAHADSAIVQKRPHKRFWCKVFVHLGRFSG